MDEKNTGYSLSDEELREIEEMSLEDLLNSVKLELQEQETQSDAPSAEEKPTVPDVIPQTPVSEKQEPAEEPTSAAKHGSEGQKKKKKEAERSALRSASAGKSPEGGKHGKKAPPAREKEPPELPERKTYAEEEKELPAFLHAKKQEAVPAIIQTKPKKNKRKRRFLPAILSYALILAALVVGALSIFSSYLESYELSRPDKAAQEYLDAQTNVYWGEMIANCGYIEITEFEDVDDVTRQYAEAIQGKKLTIRRSEGYREDAPAYIVYAGERPMARVTLRRSDRAGFGLYTWIASRTEILPDFIPEGRRVEIIAPAKTKIFVNGIVLSERYLEDWIDYSGLSELEQKFDATLPGQMVYALEGIYGNITVEAQDENGENVLPDYADGTKYQYDMKFSQKYSVIARLPATATLYINGAKVPAEYISDKAPEERLRGAREWLPDGKIPETVEYTVSGLVIPVDTVKVVDADGTELNAVETDGVLVYDTEEGEITSARRRRVEAFLEAYLNFAESTPAGGFSAVSEYLIANDELAARFQSAEKSMPQTGASAVELRDCELTGYREYGSDCFAVNANVDYYATRGDRETRQSADFELVLILSGEDWLVERMETIQPEE